AVADSMIRGGMGAKALVIGAETMSRILDWNDRGTCVLFGDGAGAVVLEADQGGKDRGVLATRLHSDGAKHDLLFVDGGPSSTRTTGYLRMEGKEVFRHAVTNLSGVVKEVLDDARLGIDQVDWLVPHQANKRILDGTAKKLGLDASRVIVTVDKHGNTSAASVPLALDTGLSEGRIKPGQVVLMEAMGGGFTWGACLARW
ncbi:MAG: beta-ketoacyl-ACP synthase 3, partial [Alphaproteobacteria bacterium]|nr:beta-ketoacyl-ACP synthase 3 [Alphaproteobacteria bacterium]